MLDDTLLNVRKPARYIGGEWNVSRKDFDRARIKFALCFPDLYEVGMSNLGLRIIYGLLNSIDDVVCQRLFAPDIDMEGLLRGSNREISSLEEQRHLPEFDLVGFSLGYELTYTNILNILDLGRIPLKSCERDARFPLIIGGGPGALNPEPLWEFFDLFVLGEAEEALLDILQIYRKHQDNFKQGKLSKEDLLLNLAQVEGVYAPALYEVKYSPEGKVLEFAPKFASAPTKIKKRFVKDLDQAFFPLEWLVPYIQLVHDRVPLELMRGCPARCRFCQARNQYYPYRIRSKENLLRLADLIYRNTGYEEFSLCGLSVSDYPKIEELLQLLTHHFKDKGVSLSLPSLRAKSWVGEVSAELAKIRKTGLTFAPEAGTQRLREILAKDFSEEEFFYAIEKAYASGYQHVKLYFMLGLPSETTADLDGIIDMANKVSSLRQKIKRGPALVNVSLNTFVPKPHTALQWIKMLNADEIESRQRYLKARVKNRNIKLNFHSREMSILEGVFSRGDRRLSQVILRAFIKGARFDAWQNYFNFDLWKNAFAESSIDYNFYLRERGAQEILPWDFLDIGISKGFLRGEFERNILHLNKLGGIIFNKNGGEDASA